MSKFDTIMKQNIYNYLRSLGWSFDHVTEDGRRIWARDVFIPDAGTVVTRYDEEESLLEMAMEARG